MTLTAGKYVAVSDFEFMYGDETISVSKDTEVQLDICLDEGGICLTIGEDVYDVFYEDLAEILTNLELVERASSDCDCDCEDADCDCEDCIDVTDEYDEEMTFNIDVKTVVDEILRERNKPISEIIQKYKGGK